jgi:hypothetical protein
MVSFGKASAVKISLPSWFGSPALGAVFVATLLCACSTPRSEEPEADGSATGDVGGDRPAADGGMDQAPVTSPDAPADVQVPDAQVTDAPVPDAPADMVGPETPPDDGSSCGAGLSACDDQCVNLKTDFDNCGACAMECRVGEFCKAGKCAPDCATGQVLCHTKCTELRDDPKHCGGCDRPCAAGQICLESLCQAPP